MDNYPPGAANDPTAPYNEPPERNESYKFKIQLQGSVNIPYYSDEQLEEKLKQAKEVLKDLGDCLAEKGWNLDIDFDIQESFSEVM